MRKLFCFAFTLFLLISPAFSDVIALNPEPKNDLVQIGSDVTVPAKTTVQRAVSVGGNVHVLGNVNQDAVSIGGNLIIHNGAIILGDAVSIGGKIEKEEGATIKGDTVEIGIANFPGVMTSKSWALGLPIIGLVSFVSFLILALFTVLFFSAQFGKNSYYIERFSGRSFLWGLLMIVLVVPICVLLAVSLIGIAFIPAYLLLLAAASFFGYVSISQLLGKRMIQAMKISHQPMMTEVTMGLFALALIGLIPLIGWLIKMVAATIGLGATYKTVFGTRD